MAEGPADALMAYSVSLSFDRRLAPFDLTGTAAHVRGLGRAGLLTDGEVRELLGAIGDVGSELRSGSFAFEPSDEDIHTAIERRLTELLPGVGEKVHTGRSRNDQVATALRLYVKSIGAELVDGLLRLAATLGRRAVDAADAYLPGFTHLQRAQPVLLAHLLYAHGWAILRDVDRLHAALERADVSPLGAGALGGSSLPLEPLSVAKDLGFSATFENSLDAVADRDFVAELLFVLALCGVHLSRLGEEVVIYSSEEFGYFRLPDAWSTGSSMLPQKKNPDIAELARGKAGRLIGNLTGVLATLKSLPLAYNRDLQEDKEPLFDTVDQILLGCNALEGLVGAIGFDTDAMASAAGAESLVAIDLAEYLVASGLPFRRAHEVVGGLVRRALVERRPLQELVIADSHFGERALGLFEPGSSVRRRATRGGGGIAAVGEQRHHFEAAMARERSRLEEFRRGLPQTY